MGQAISTLRGIVSNIETSCDGLRNLVRDDLVGQGLIIVAKIKEFIAAFPWYYSTAYAVGAIMNFLPEILNMMDEWIRTLRSVWQNIKYEYSNVLLSDSLGPNIKSFELEKRIVELDVENKKMQKLMKENQDYARKNSIHPFNIFTQNNPNQIPFKGRKLEKQPIKTKTYTTNYGSNASM